MTDIRSHGQVAITGLLPRLRGCTGPMLGCGLAVLILGGCATNGVNLVQTGDVSVERIQTRDAYPLWTHVYQAEDVLVVYGAVRRNGQSKFPLRGHVDIRPQAEDGSLIEHVPVSYYPRNLPTRGLRPSRFQARIPVIAPTGATVLVWHHLGSHSATRKDAKL